MAILQQYLAESRGYENRVETELAHAYDAAFEPDVDDGFPVELEYDDDRY